MNTTTPWAQAALRYEEQNIRGAGARSDARRALLSASANLFEIEAGGTLNRSQIEATLTAAAIDANIPMGDIQRSIAWGAKKGALEPRVAPVRDFEPLDISERRLQIQDWYNQVWESGLPAREKKTAYAIAALALRLGKTRFSASYRQLAEEMNISYPMVGKLTKGLGGFLLINAKGNRIKGTATTWQLAIDGNPLTGMQGVTPDTCRRQNSSEKERLDSVLPPPPSGTTELVSQASLLSPDHSLWSRRQNAWMLFSRLAAGDSFNIKGLANKLGMNDRTIKQNLRWLEGKGLVRQLGREEGWVWEIIPQENEIEDDQAPKEARRAAHARHRKDWKTWVSNLIDARRISQRRSTHRVAARRALRLTSSDISSKELTDAHSNQAGRPSQRHEVLRQGSQGGRHPADSSGSSDDRPRGLGGTVQSFRDVGNRSL